MSSEEIKKLYEIWNKIEIDDLKFMLSFLNSRYPIFGETIERLSAYKAYESLPKEEKLEFGLYSEELDPLFFVLDKDFIDWIEKTLPPYPTIVSNLYNKKGLKSEEIEIMTKRSINPITNYRVGKKKRDIIKKYGLISEEFEKVNQKIQERRWKAIRNTMIPLYGISAASIMIYTKDPVSSLLSWLPFPILFNLGRYITFKTENRKIKNFIDRSLTAALIASSPESYIRVILEFGVGAPLLSYSIEKLWPYVPRSFKKFFYNLQLKSSGIKTKKFDEKEVRNLLYNVNISSENIPNYLFEEYKNQIENGIIEVEDPRKTLISTYGLSYYRRKKVASLEGNEVKIIDNEYVKKLAQIEGTFLKDFENRLKRYPTKYLGVSVLDDKIYFVRDIIGILPSQIESGLAYKEAYCCLLGKKSDNIFSIYYNI
ncbi:MAG: hypothetical protein QXX30_02055 [Candidatus Aenigmatarchaeota archaeon]